MRRALCHLRALPRALWWCAAIATANAACWAAITPAFWVPDEPAHAGYVQHLAETGRTPSILTSVTRAVDPELSQEQSFVYGRLPFGAEGRPSWLVANDRSLQALLRTDLTRTAPTQALYLGNSPPLYYALEALPYRAAASRSFLDRLLAMRLFSGLFAGLTVAFCFLFIRELLPARSWTWTVGALAVAFQPLLGFISGGVNNDALVYAVCAAVLWGVARAFRRGLTPASGALIGGALAAGLLTKLTVVGLLPGLAVAFALLVWKAGRESRRSTLLGAGAAVATAAVPYALWLTFSHLTAEDAATPFGGLADRAASDGTAALREQLSYIWQAILPRLPFMDDKIPHYVPWDTYLEGFVGRFGWFEYEFADGWNVVAAGVLAVVLALAVRACVRQRAALRARWLEGLAYLALAGGVLLSVEVAAYRYFTDVGVHFEQARYLFPVLALYGGLVSLAALGAGQRWGKAVGTLLVVLAMGHSLFSQLLTVARFYG